MPMNPKSPTGWVATSFKHHQILGFCSAFIYFVWFAENPKVVGVPRLWSTGAPSPSFFCRSASPSAHFSLKRKLCSSVISPTSAVEDSLSILMPYWPPKNKGCAEVLLISSKCEVQHNSTDIWIGSVWLNSVDVFFVAILVKTSTGSCAAAPWASTAL